jgi:signal transduction histidine kinase
VVLDRYDQTRSMVNRSFHAHAVLGVPISWRGQLIGSFGLAALPPRRFESEDVEVLSLYARHAAVAIQNARHYQRDAARIERLELLARIGRSLATDLNLDGLCANAVEMIHEHMGFPNVGLGLIEPRDPETIVIRHLGGGFRRPLPYERRIHVSQGIMGAAARERKTQLVQDVRRDPRYLPPPVPDGILAELAVPIVHADEVLGVLNLESAAPFAEEDAGAVQMIADYLAVAIRNAREFSDVRGWAVTQERRRLARDLHDSITQMVFSASLMAQSIVPAWQKDPAEGERLSGRVVELTRRALTELRSLLHELRPADDDSFSIRSGELPALERLRRVGLPEMIRVETGDCGLAAELELGAYRPQPQEIEEALFWVFQEALHNVVKHARASWVRVLLECTDGVVTLKVSDNGIGFDGARSRGTLGMGLHSMSERLAALSGSLRVESNPGRGVMVEAVLPRRAGA